jgi:hypothetical protein
MIVELDIFSGRPNPQWTLDDPACRAVLDLERSLAPGAASPGQPPPPLGYRGFLYAPSGDDPRRAFLGRVERADRVLDDPEFSIERLLLRSLPPELAPLGERIAPLLEARPRPD